MEEGSGSGEAFLSMTKNPMLSTIRRRYLEDLRPGTRLPRCSTGICKLRPWPTDQQELGQPDAQGFIKLCQHPGQLGQEYTREPRYNRSCFPGQSHGRGRRGNRGQSVQQVDEHRRPPCNGQTAAPQSPYKLCEAKKPKKAMTNTLANCSLIGLAEKHQIIIRPHVQGQPEN